MKLTHVPGAVLFQYVDNQAPVTDVQYEIGEEDVESARNLYLSYLFFSYLSEIAE